MNVWLLMLLPLVASGQTVAGIGRSPGQTSEDPKTWGLVADAEKADVLVEVQEVPAASVVPDRFLPKLNPPDLCRVMLVRMTNRGAFPGAFKESGSAPVCRGADVWLEGTEGQVGIPAVGGHWRDGAYRFLGVTREQLGANTEEGHALKRQFGITSHAMSAYWSTVAIPQPLFGPDNEALLSRRLERQVQFEWLADVIDLGPTTNSGKSAIALLRGQDFQKVLPDLQDQSVLWPGSSVWGYVLFQLNRPALQVNLCLDLGKGVTWCVVERDDLAEQVASEAGAQ